MRKYLSIILISILCILLTAISNASEELTRTQLVELANRELITMGICAEDYFAETNKSYKVLSKNKYLTDYRNYIVYGDPHGDFREDRYRYLGYTMSDANFTNYLFPNDVTSINGLWNRNWVEDPKWNSLTKSRAEVKDEGTFNNNPLYEESIRLGLKLISRKNPDGSLLDFPDDKVCERQWYKYVHIYQPPTSVSWGCGIMFHNPSGTNINYLTVPLSPEGLKGDLSAQFEELPSSATPGDKVQVLIQIKSTYKKNLSHSDGNAPYFKWEIIDKATTKQITPVTYDGYAKNDTGNIEITAYGESALLAEFVMPKNDVNVKFEINKDGTSPSETQLDNNVLDTVITPAVPIKTTGRFDLDYNVLSRKVKFPLANGKDIAARLTAPRGDLSGNAWGELNINNDTPELFGFKSFTLDVDEPAGTIIKHPEIKATINRKDATYDQKTQLYDNPAGGKWLKGPDSKTANASISFGGTAYGKYEYDITKTNDDGSTYSESKTRTTRAVFNSGTDIRDITTYIYNGKPTITAKSFENKIDSNTTNHLQKNLFWTSDPYKFNVIRWMCHQAEDNSFYDWTAVPGQYQRIFTQQNSGVLKWMAASTMEKEYKRSREAARRGDYRKAEYDKAVFASDIVFKNVAYPIKSGYYFNPTGAYTFTFETVTYKTNRDATKDHDELVDAVINSFRYESDLMYINSKKEPVNIQNESLTKSGSSYARRPAALTANDPTGVDGVKLLKVAKTGYMKDVEEIKHSQESDGYTHEYLRAILEGYEESDTIGSKNNYKYREYIKDGQNIYKITEKTTVSIQINPDNINVYTHIKMPDGKYTVAAWIGDIALSDSVNEYKKLGTLKGIYSLDKVEVTVHGSIYDDQNATIGN